MTAAMKLLLRVICRRMGRGETLEEILVSYPKLTEEERTLLRNALQ